ncbi:unnamed protein product [Polarella glacialis]|uniref:Uncharacterized protein n=1 Tax=Polarella glacialis TaxID=89957 RepID=A0A813GML2_POLGL|nr:unnamed protein product [Polarella glacialis]
MAPGIERQLSFEEEKSSSSLRILVAGDAAVGKTRLCELLCSGSCSGHAVGDLAVMTEGPAGGQPQQEWTCGCTLSVVHETVEIDMRTVDVEVELWEVGGTKTYSCARPVFYDGLDAVILVYDVSNMKSYHNLVAWLFELCVSVVPPSLKYWDAGGGSGGVPDVDLELADSGAVQQGIFSGRFPVLFIANKCDLHSRGEVGALPRPRPPEKPMLLDRLLGGGGESVSCRTPADAVLMERLCDFILGGRHTESSCRDGAKKFDFSCWQEFVRRVYQAKNRIG